MALEDDLKTEVATKFRAQWSITQGRVVPTEASVGLGNVGIEIEATILYADLSDSTQLVDEYSAQFAAEIYGTFLRCASRIIRDNNGTITSFDGDRVMAVYMGEEKESDACWTGLKINRAMLQIIKPALQAQYPNIDYIPQHTVGIDSSRILVIKDGIRGSNDLIWVGRAANYAAKLCALSHDYQTRITQPVMDKLSGPLLLTVDKTLVWESEEWNDMHVYRSSCYALGL